MQGPSTHRTDAHLLCNVAGLVNVDLVEVDGVGVVGELLEDGRDLLARAAPGRPEVEHRRAFALNLCVHPRMSPRRPPRANGHDVRLP